MGTASVIIIMLWGGYLNLYCLISVMGIEPGYCASMQVIFNLRGFSVSFYDVFGSYLNIDH